MPPPPTLRPLPRRSPVSTGQRSAVGTCWRPPSRGPTESSRRRRPRFGAERLEETRGAEAIGWASTKDFLTHLTGARKSAGASLVRVAQHTADLPEVRAALNAGEISLAQAWVIGSRVTTLPKDMGYRERTAAALLDLVNNQSYEATDLDRCFAHLAKELDTDGLLLATDVSKDLQERGAHGARFLSLTPDTWGGARIKGYTSLEEASWSRPP